MFLWKSEPPLPTRSLRSLRAAARSAALHYACKRSHPFVAASEKSTCLMQRSKAFGHAVGWKRGCQPFSYRCSQNVRHCRKEICWTCLFKKSIPAILFWISKHPLPARSRFLRAAVRSTMSALWLHHAHAFVAAAEKRRLSAADIHKM